MTLVYPGRVSLYCFIIPSISVVFVSLFCAYGHELIALNILLLYYKLLYDLAVKLFSGYVFDVAVRGLFLGAVFWAGVNICLNLEGTISILGWYLCVLSYFHWSEFVAIAAASPDSLTLDSYLLNHSSEYGIALAAGVFEFFVEWLIFPSIKSHTWLSMVGLCICICGEMVRKAAILTAAGNFTHLIAWEKRPEATLITHGVYAISRHPGYVGWFYWSIATQLVLLNPICIVAYTIFSWKFFAFRIVQEEMALLIQFNEEYTKYQKKVGTGLPFIRGYIIDDTIDKKVDEMVKDIEDEFQFNENECGDTINGKKDR